MEGHFYNEEAVAKLFDDVLVRCIIEFRQALGLLERNGLAAHNPLAGEMRRALGVMEAELDRRSSAPVLHRCLRTEELEKPASLHSTTP